MSATGQFHHKGYTIDQRDQIIGLIEACYLDILHSMETEGYRSDRRSAFATGGIGGLIIWNDGELVSGPAATHRKAAARILGMTSPFPMRVVGLHRGWLTSVGLTVAQDLRRLPHALRALPGIHSK